MKGMSTDRGPNGANVVSLPPLRQSAEWDTAVSDTPATSPLRRTKKAELMSYALGKHVPGASSPTSGFSPAATAAAAGATAAAAGSLKTAGIMLDTAARSKQMALTSDNRQHLSGLLLESWVNQVLAGPGEQHNSGLPNQQPLQPSQAAFKGLLKHGLTKEELANAGLGADAVSRLYRTLYVYSVGLFDTLQELLGHSPHKEELLMNVWGAYLSISESALQVAFKSDYLSLAAASSAAMNELLFAKEALSEAQSQHTQMSRDLHLLSSAHAEQAALRRALALQNQQLKTDLQREGCAHNHAVTKYADGLETLAQRQLDLETLQEKYAQMEAEHAALQSRHDELIGVYSELQTQCKQVRDVFHNLSHDLRSDPLLVKEMPPEPPSTFLEAPAALAASNRGSNTDDTAPGTTTGTAAAGAAAADQNEGYLSSFEEAVAAEAVAAAAVEASRNPMLAHQMGPLAGQLQQVVETMFKQWRTAIIDADDARTTMFRTKDELAAARAEGYTLKEEYEVLEAVRSEVQRQLEDSQAHCTNLEQRLQTAHDVAAAAKLDMEQAQRLQEKTAATLQEVTEKCTQLEDQVYDLGVQLKNRDATARKQQHSLDRATETLQRKIFQLQQHSRALAVSMQSLWQQQTSRLYLRQQLGATRQQLAHTLNNLEDKEIRIKDATTQIAHQQKKVEKLKGEITALESSVRDAQGQVVALTQRLALSEGRCQDLNKCYEELQVSHGALYTSNTETKAELEKTAANWEMSKAEVARLKETLATTDKALLDERLKGKGLQADLMRLYQEKQDVLDRLEATKARLELHVQQLQAEAQVTKKQMELMQNDLDTERDRVTSVKAMLEVKREKKRRWKAATKQAEADTAAVHQKLLAKSEEMVALDSRLRSMDITLKLLGAGTSSAGGADTGRSTSKKTGPLFKTTSTRPVTAASFGLTDEAPASPKEEGDATGPLSAFHPDGRPLDVPEARKLLEAAWTELNKASKVSGVLNDQLADVDKQKHEMLLKLAATDAANEIAQQISRILTRLRNQQESLQQQRKLAEEAKTAAGNRVIEAQAVVRTAVEARAAQREAILNTATAKVEDMLHSAAMGQVFAAEEAEAALQQRLMEQMEMMVQCEKQRQILEESVQQLEVGAQGFLNRINRLQSEKADLESQLGVAKDNVNYLQVEVAALKAERERIRTSVASANDKLIHMQQQLIMQQQEFDERLREVEEDHEEELMAAQSEHEAQLLQASNQYTTLQNHTEAVQMRAGQLQRVVEMLALEMSALKQGSFGPPPVASLQRLGSAVMPGPSAIAAAAAAAAAAAGKDGGAKGSEDDHQLDLPKSAFAPASGEANKSGGAGLWCGLWGDGGVDVGNAGVLGAGGGGTTVCGTRWLHRHQAKNAWSYAQVVLRQLSDEGSNAGFGAITVFASLPPALSIPGLVFPADSVNMMIGEIYLAKISSDALTDAAAGCDGENFVVPGHRRDLEGVAYDYMLARIGAKPATEAHLSALLAGLVKYQARFPRMRLFARLLGMQGPPVTAAGVNFTMHLLAQVHAECGPLMGEATEGGSAVSCKTAMHLVEPLLKGAVEGACPDVQGLPKKLVQMAGGHKEYAIETDVLLEMALEAWMAQRQADHAALVDMIRNTDTRGRGLATLDDLLQLVKQANPATGAALSQEQLSQLFDLGLRLSGTHATTVTVEGAASMLLEAGLVGSSAHVAPHAVITEKPPFSEYRLLEDSWRVLRGAMLELIKEMTKPRGNMAFGTSRSSAAGAHPQNSVAGAAAAGGRPGSAGSSILEAAAIQAAVKKLDDTLEAGVAAGEAWKQYRRLLAFYSIHGVFVDPLDGKRPVLKDIEVGSEGSVGLPTAGLRGGLLKAIATNQQGGSPRTRNGNSFTRMASNKKNVLIAASGPASSGVLSRTNSSSEPGSVAAAVDGQGPGEGKGAKGPGRVSITGTISSAAAAISTATTSGNNGSSSSNPAGSIKEAARVGSGVNAHVRNSMGGGSRRNSSVGTHAHRESNRSSANNSRRSSNAEGNGQAK